MTQKSTPISIKKWEVKSANISFKIKNAGLIVPGTFKDFEGNIQFDPDNLEESSLEGSINTNTINTANSLRDFHLRMADYFRTGKYPSIHMKSIKLEKQASDFLGTFEVTIKGKTKKIKIPFSFETQEEHSLLKAHFEINRLDFGVGSRSFVLNSVVRVRIEIEVF